MMFGSGYLYRPAQNTPQSWQGWKVSPSQPDARQPAGTPRWPDQAPAARRLADYTVITAAMPPVPPPPIRPYFPDVARGPARSTPDVYSVVTAAMPTLVALDLGRFRCGDRVNLQFALPGQTSVPVLTVTGPNGATPIPLSTRDGNIFTTQIFLGAQWLLGNYVATVQVQAVSFEVVAGGDPAGGIVSIHASKTVNGWLVLAQLRSGQLTAGSNPKLP